MLLFKSDSFLFSLVHLPQHSWSSHRRMKPGKEGETNIKKRNANSFLMHTKHSKFILCVPTVSRLHSTIMSLNVGGYDSEFIFFFFYFTLLRFRLSVDLNLKFRETNEGKPQSLKHANRISLITLFIL